MPLRNRVTPFGEIISTEARGTLYGNRGVLHNPDKQIVRRYTTRAWIACVLEFKGRRRRLLMPGRFTELFFLDEATALAAGHRPCGECRRESYGAFRAAWLRGNASLGLGPKCRVDEIDRVIHADRIYPRGEKVTYRARIEGLPDGTFIDLAGAAFLVLGDRLLEWSPAGYVAAKPRFLGTHATVLTPRSIVNAIAAGYCPALHDSAHSLP
ncbi:MAG: hypothetical protein WAW06_12285 [bacterium]